MTLAALLEQPAEAYRVLKILGRLYLVYLSALTAVAAKANAWLKRPRVTTILERVSGGILGALGIGTVALGVTE